MSEKFGNYELLEKMAVGGMAEIFRARSFHGQGVEKTIVIKRIHPALSNEKNFVAMFIDEARLGVSMVHGNIVPVFDFGCVDGYYFLAMEYVVGQDLATLHARVRMVDMTWPIELALHLVMEVLEGLQYAHGKRDDKGRPLELVHRDVSPSNILLSEDGQVKLLDFGIARSEAREYETRTGVIKGKPGYMSPEQAAGRSVDARADVWSCGAVLHELVTGQRLKDGRIPAPEEAIEAILDKALAANPDDRYTGARELQDALAFVLADRGIRPNAGDLKEFVHAVNAAEVTREDWDMQSEAVEQHVAEALAFTTPKTDEHEADKRGTIQSTPPPGTKDALQITRRIGNAPRAPRLRWIAAISLLTLATVLVTGLLIARSTSGDGPPSSVSSAARESARADSHREHSDVRSTTHISTQDPPNIPETKPKTAAMEITTDPPGAKISVNGNERGISPLRLAELESGSYLLVASLAGRQDSSQSVELSAGQAREITLSLPKTPTRKARHPAKPALLSINSEPWSNVVLDGKRFGTTPILNKEIPPGKHRIVLTNPVRNLTHTTSFTVRAGESKRIRKILTSE